MVTGAGGSIGRELCRQIAQHRPALLILIGHGENSIFEIEQELKRKFPALITQAVIADIRHHRHLEAVFAQYRPQVVFHAAAHKHVPLMEANAMEAVTNNVLGTRNVVRAAEGSGVERLVMISTDKAVQPQNVMGGTKRLAEWVVQAAARRTGRPFVAVRFGNVLNSRGSVIPLFREQIRNGGPVTVTHEDMTRYFMTIPEAVQLVLQAGVIGKGGEVFVLDMGEPVKIVDLARDMIELSGLKPYEDIEIVFTGIRPGEKLHETLFYSDESLAYTPHSKILITRNGCGSVVDGLEDTLSRLEQLTAECREIEIRDALETIMAGCRAPEPEAVFAFASDAVVQRADPSVPRPPGMPVAPLQLQPDDPAAARPRKAVA
jgi:FlaA1/EpsC-like NDP-sugar epimerase